MSDASNREQLAGFLKRGGVNSEVDLTESDLGHPGERGEVPVLLQALLSGRSLPEAM